MVKTPKPPNVAAPIKRQDKQSLYSFGGLDDNCVASPLVLLGEIFFRKLVQFRKSFDISMG
ncbi:4014_t:CDS:2 [Funneliformis mosseae]|uniref:4014_t:CDS:1 n=1 Tax=Funneliformis mosseae TaxID=27381 RepID=A0A9N8ZK15_FUNMO|nr:4014_t:CDS:2 [Funneliformis mosseae]